MLSLEQLGLTINNQALFAEVSLTLLPSSIIYLQGPNGCGKTSLLRIIAGLQKPTSGQVYWLYLTEHQKGSPVQKKLVVGNKLLVSELEKPYCTYVGHNLALKMELTVLENLSFWSANHDSSEMIEASIHYFGLYELLYKKCYELSSGTQKKVALARLMSCQSNLWLLDEVETNLDQENQYLLNNLLIAKANQGGIIIISTHGKQLIKSALELNLSNYTKG